MLSEPVLWFLRWISCPWGTPGKGGSCAPDNMTGRLSHQENLMSPCREGQGRTATVPREPCLSPVRASVRFAQIAAGLLAGDRESAQTGRMTTSIATQLRYTGSSLVRSVGGHRDEGRPDVRIRRGGSAAL